MAEIYQLRPPPYETDLTVLDRLGHLHGPGGRFVSKGGDEFDGSDMRKSALSGKLAFGVTSSEKLALSLHREAVEYVHHYASDKQAVAQLAFSSNLLSHTVGKIELDDKGNIKDPKVRARLEQATEGIVRASVTLHHESDGGAGEKAKSSLEAATDVGKDVALRTINAHFVAVGSTLAGVASQILGSSTDAGRELMQHLAESQVGDSVANWVTAALVGGLAMLILKKIRGIHDARIQRKRDEALLKKGIV